MLSLARGPIRTSAIAVASAAIAVSVFAATAIAQDAPEVIRIFSHPVHQRVSTGDQGGDITAAWQAESGIEIEWNTLDVGPLQDRLFRELSLPENEPVWETVSLAPRCDEPAFKATMGIPASRARRAAAAKRGTLRSPSI